MSKIFVLATRSKLIRYCIECPLHHDDEDVCGNHTVVCSYTDTLIGRASEVDKVQPLRDCPLPDQPNSREGPST